eukprot:PITA_10591
MACQQEPTKMERIIVASYADNLDISEDDVWMRVFVQSLDGEARKWFKELAPRSIVDIEELDDVFLKHWGDKKDLLYYHTEFGNLKRENGESLSNFNKRFSLMYSKIPAEVKPMPTSAKITYANTFDSDFCLLLRERRCAMLAKMQDATLEVESNIMVVEKLKGRDDRRRSRTSNVKENPIQRDIVPTEHQTIKQKRPVADPDILKAPVQEVIGPDKSPSPFNFESEVQKLKISIPLIELVKSETFRKPILDALELKAMQASSNCVNLQDEKPIVVLNPMTEPSDNSSPSFYVFLTIHDKTLHNCLLDTGASHNLMPRAIMEELGIDITRPYHDLFSFDSRKVKCLGLIKDLAVTLTQLPMKNIMMDIVVADVPPKFGMLLSRG